MRRSGPTSRGGVFCLSGWRLPGGGGDQGGEPLSGSGAHAGEQVLVGVDREGGVGVTEPFADDLDVFAVSDEQRRVGVAKVVNRTRGMSVRARIRLKSWLIDCGLR